MEKQKGFVSETSRLAWDCFKTTGQIGFYLLYANIEHPPVELQNVMDEGRDF